MPLTLLALLPALCILFCLVPTALRMAMVESTPGSLPTQHCLQLPAITGQDVPHNFLASDVLPSTSDLLIDALFCMEMSTSNIGTTIAAALLLLLPVLLQKSGPPCHQRRSS